MDVGCFGGGFYFGWLRAATGMEVAKPAQGRLSGRKVGSYTKLLLASFDRSLKTRIHGASPRNDGGDERRCNPRGWRKKRRSLGEERKP